MKFLQGLTATRTSSGLLRVSILFGGLKSIAFSGLTSHHPTVLDILLNSEASVFSTSTGLYLRPFEVRHDAGSHNVARWKSCNVNEDRIMHMNLTKKVPSMHVSCCRVSAKVKLCKRYCFSSLTIMLIKIFTHNNVFHNRQKMSVCQSCLDETSLELQFRKIYKTWNKNGRRSIVSEARWNNEAFKHIKTLRQLRPSPCGFELCIQPWNTWLETWGDSSPASCWFLWPKCRNVTRQVKPTRTYKRNHVVKGPFTISWNIVKWSKGWRLLAFLCPWSLQKLFSLDNFHWTQVVADITYSEV